MQPPAPKADREVRHESYGGLASSRGRSLSAANGLTPRRARSRREHPRPFPDYNVCAVSIETRDMRERSTHLTPTHTRTDPWRSDGSSTPSDFSPASRPAFKRAVELARSLRSQLLIVHVMGPLPIIGEGYITPETVETLLQSQRHLAQRQLRVLVTRAKTAGVRASGLLVETGMPHEQIVRVARRKRADMIAMGTHGRTGLTRLLLGSVAARVIATAKCPVLTVHA